MEAEILLEGLAVDSMANLLLWDKSPPQYSFWIASKRAGKDYFSPCCSLKSVPLFLLPCHQSLVSLYSWFSPPKPSSVLADRVISLQSQIWSWLSSPKALHPFPFSWYEAQGPYCGPSSIIKFPDCPIPRTLFPFHVMLTPPSNSSFPF